MNATKTFDFFGETAGCLSAVGGGCVEFGAFAGLHFGE